MKLKTKKMIDDKRKNEEGNRSQKDKSMTSSLFHHLPKQVEKRHETWQIPQIGYPHYWHDISDEFADQFEHPSKQQRYRWGQIEEEKWKDEKYWIFWWKVKERIRLRTLLPWKRDMSLPYLILTQIWPWNSEVDNDPWWRNLFRREIRKNRKKVLKTKRKNQKKGGRRWDCCPLWSDWWFTTLSWGWTREKRTRQRRKEAKKTCQVLLKKAYRKHMKCPTRAQGQRGSDEDICWEVLRAYGGKRGNTKREVRRRKRASLRQKNKEMHTNKKKPN